MFEAMERFTDMTSELNAVRRVSPLLLKQDDHTAAADLVAVLQEVEKTFVSLEMALVQFLSLQFESRREDDMNSLIRLRGGEATKLIGMMRARCSKIGGLYWNSLRDWFARSGIDEDQRQALDSLFIAIEDSDEDVIKPAVEQIVNWLNEQVTETDQLVSEGKFKAAKMHVASAGKMVAPVRQKMNQIASDFLDLEIQFTR